MLARPQRDLLERGDQRGAPFRERVADRDGRAGVDGAVEQVPQAIVDQVADGGEVALALIEGGVSRLCVGRVVAGAFGTTAFSDAAAAVLPGFQKARTFNF